MENVDTTYINDKVLKYESFVNDTLREDLKIVHENLQRKNSEIAEWIQLKNIIQSLQETDLSQGFKSKMDIGTNIYVQTHVPDASHILISVGCGVYVEFTLDEALVVIEKRITFLTKQVEIIKVQSSQIKARIKLVLHGIRELENIK